MAVTPDRVFGPAAPGTTTAVLATVPASTRWTIKSIVVTNTTATAATVTLGIGGTAAANRILSALVVPGDGVVVMEPWIPMDAAETLDGLQGTSGALSVTVAAVAEDV